MILIQLIIRPIILCVLNMNTSDFHEVWVVISSTQNIRTFGESAQWPQEIYHLRRYWQRDQHLMNYVNIFVLVVNGISWKPY